MPSSRFQVLAERIEELRQLLLPAEFDPTGSYAHPMQTTTCALSFRVLAHAELESYLEDRALEVATTALQAWRTRKHVSIVAFHLIAFSGMIAELPPDTLYTTDQNKIKTWQARITIDDRFDKSVNDYHNKIRNKNHGVKEKNIVSMFIPLGFDMSNCDELFLQTMSTFGEARGTVAHTSGRSHVQKAVDPKDEYTVLLNILAALDRIDSEFDRLLCTAKGP
jgi:hypothetical protein